MEDDLRPEYNLKDLQVRQVGSDRKDFGGKTIHLEPDVAEVFPDANSVNQALRFLIKMTKQNQKSISKIIMDKNTNQ
ncbi:MAG: hypothetical protein ACRC2S_28710 [Waterburya sp.]